MEKKSLEQLLTLDKKMLAKLSDAQQSLMKGGDNNTNPDTVADCASEETPCMTVDTIPIVAQCYCCF